uniref:Uncharacterized protein n=1 Tax=Rhizophora mucronata TaxID=61149 RepID=A0A2P2Q003_RHIMU
MNPTSKWNNQGTTKIFHFH